MDSNKHTSTPSRLIIRTTPRSGSNLLCHSLSQHPEIKYTGEYFNPDPERTLQEFWDNRMSGNWNLTKLMYLEPIPNSNYHSNKFSVTYDDYSSLDVPLLSYNPVCLFLYRENIAEQHESYLRACRSGEWVNGLTVDPIEPLVDFVERVQVTNTELINQCRYHISYEELLSNWDDVISKILDIMQWKSMSLPPALTKQTYF